MVAMYQTRETLDEIVTYEIVLPDGLTATQIEAACKDAVADSEFNGKEPTELKRYTKDHIVDFRTVL